ncbi:MAG: glycerophosphoryl diester phosphodiesterase [Acidimicrobiales bacterium]|jgi:glycerophosphoryl diester phosphodiesterase
MEFVAHRAGNTVDTLHAAQRVADVIEVDVHLGADSLPEVRHAKLLWPTRRFWERWYLLPEGTVAPHFDEILAAAEPTTALWLDLKGFTRRLSRRVILEIEDRQEVTVSSKSWWLLDPFVDQPGVRVFRSVGNRFELALLLSVPSRVRLDGVVAHHRLLSDRVVRQLLRRGQVFTWAVGDIASIERLARLGVQGVILDDLALIAPGRSVAAAADKARAGQDHRGVSNP